MTDLNIDNALQVLQENFGYSTFRSIQSDIINSILQKQDTLALLPTSEGKSICYQIPALMFEGMTVVISPLIALQEDQVSTLKKQGIAAELLNSDLSISERKRIEKEILEDKIKLLYVAPETLFTDSFKDLLKYKKVSLIAVDEAHCFKGNTKVTTNIGKISFKELYELPDISGITVKSFNQTLKKIEYKPLVKVYKNNHAKMIKLDLGTKGVITVTTNHLFITPSGNKQAGDLRLGHKVYISTSEEDLAESTVLSITYPRGKQEYLYDLEVKDNHNYFVSSSRRKFNVLFEETEILVHNCTSIYSDFRPNYEKLYQIRSLDCFKSAPVLAVTATADLKIISDIETNIGLKKDFKTFKKSFDRPSINYHVLEKKLTYKKDLINLIKLHGKDSCGIIYCMTKNDTEILSSFLNSLGFKSAPYHASIKNISEVTNEKGKKLSAKAYKKYVLEQFLDNKINIVCATIAFGMGVDKPNIRWVIHNDTPNSMENFIQECGRASRDGLPSSTYLFYDPKSYHKSMYMINKSTTEPRRRAIKINKLKQMHQYAYSSKCRRHLLLKYFGEDFPTYCGKCDNCGAEKLNTGNINEN